MQVKATAPLATIRIATTLHVDMIFPLEEAHRCRVEVNIVLIGEVVKRAELVVED